MSYHEISQELRYMIFIKSEHQWRSTGFYFDDWGDAITTDFSYQDQPTLFKC